MHSRAELKKIIEKFSQSGWDVIAIPSKKWLDDSSLSAQLIEAIEIARKECGSCGCEYDELYPRALFLIDFFQELDFDLEKRVITTRRLLLRTFQNSDALLVSRYCNNYSLYKSTLSLPFPYLLEHAVTWIQNQKQNFDNDNLYEFAITDKKTGLLLGSIALSNQAIYQHGELAYWIAEEFWGKGYASEAALAILDFAFEIKQYHKVYARFFSSNPASGRVMEKIGMTQEGILREHVKKQDHFEDLVYFGILGR